MPSSLICLNSRATLADIRTQQTEFVAAYTLATTDSSAENLQHARNLKLSLESKIRALQETLYPVEAERRFNLREQYNSQLAILNKSGFLDGNPHAIPSYDQILAKLVEGRELLGVKAEQNFTKLVLVPFGLALDSQFTKFRAYLKAYKKLHPTFGRLDPTTPDTSDQPGWDPLYAWDKLTEANVVYYPQSFDANHQGKTKAELPAWTILLLQTDDSKKPSGQQGIRAIPRASTNQVDGTGEHRRLNLEAGQSPRVDLAQQLAAKQISNSPYRGESALTPEDWLAMFITHLEATGQPLDNLYNPNGQESLANLTGAYVPGSSGVPYGFWYRVSRQANVDWIGPDDSGEVYGTRSAVRV